VFAVYAVLHHLALQRIAMYAERLACFGLISSGTEQNALNHSLLQNLNCLFEKQAGINQMIEKILERLSHYQ
jgi:hypothetical protein